MSTDLRALLVSYAFPPVGGAGVQRSVKLAKYLPEHSVQPSILTVSNPSAPLRDATFDRDLPPGMEILRARTFEPGYAAKQATWSAATETDQPSLKKRVIRRAVGLAKQLLVPDPQLLWVPAANWTLGRRLFSPQTDDVVFITAPPFSQFLLAPLARLKRGTAVVLDYRDEWSTARETYEMLRGPVAGAVGDPLEASLLRCAHAVTTATEQFRENLLARFRFLDPTRVYAIPNGYDTDDLPATLPTPSTDRFVISYAGTIFKLTSARGLLGAVRRLHEHEPELAKLLELRFMGRIVDTELDAFEGTEQLGVKRLGYVGHDTVLDQLASSHLVLCLLDDVTGVERIYPAKIFELMVLGRRILTLSPQGALTELVAQHRLGDVLAPRDEAGITEYLAGQLRAFRDRGGQAPCPPEDIDEDGIGRYHRRALAGEFAAVMRDAVTLARRR